MTPTLRLTTLLLLTQIFVPSLFSQAPPPDGEKAEILATRKIYDKAPHNAASDIFRWQNLWYVAFRTADTNAGTEGQIQLLASFDTVNWSPVSAVSEKGVDLREPKLSVTKEDRLMLFSEGVTYDKGQLGSKQPRVTTSTDGRNWVPPQKYLAGGEWMWRPIWQKEEGRFYGASYHTHPTTPGPKPEKEWAIKLHSSLDGKVWQLASLWQLTGLPKEGALALKPDGSMVAVVGKEGGDRKGFYGTSTNPYSTWTWQPLPVPLMGPNLIVLPDGRVIGASLGFGATPGAHVILFEVKDGVFTPLVELPSGGECGHPGLAFHEDLLFVTYHSAHEEKKPVIYFAKVRLK